MRNSEDPLKAIEKCKKEIAKRKEDYRSNERHVRNRLINPVLRSLGWDVESSDVIAEEGTRVGHPDYQLVHRGFRILIEAKPLNKLNTGKKNRTDAKKQLMDYLLGLRAPYGVLTNGEEWMLFSSLEKNHRRSEDPIWHVNISNDVNGACTKLTNLSKKNLRSLEKSVRRKIGEQEIAAAWNEEKGRERKWSKLISKEIKAKFKRKPIEKLGISNSRINRFSVLTVREMFEKEDVHQKESVDIKPSKKSIKRDQKEITESVDQKKPKKITIIGTSRPVKSYGDVLAETANILIEKKLLTNSKLPIFQTSNSKQKIIDKKPFDHMSGNKFRRYKQIEKGYFVSIAFNSKSLIKHSHRLLEEAGLKKKDLKIEYRNS